MYMQQYESMPRLQADRTLGCDRHMSVCRRNVDNFPLHWHNYFEIEIILSGRGQHDFNGTQRSLARGDVYFLTPVDFHRVQVLEPVELINISFDESCLRPEILETLSDGLIKCRTLEDAELGRMVAAAELLEYECASGGPCTGQLLEYLLSSFPRRTVPQGSREQLSGIRKAIAYMDLHFRERITLEQLSALSGYNPSYFSELFRKVTGQSYIHRLKELRLRYSAMLLRSGVSVSDACYASGFGSLSNYLTSFKARYGMPPRDYSRPTPASPFGEDGKAQP